MEYSARCDTTHDRPATTCPTVLRPRSSATLTEMIRAPGATPGMPVWLPSAARPLPVAPGTAGGAAAPGRRVRGGGRGDGGAGPVTPVRAGPGEVRALDDPAGEAG